MSVTITEPDGKVTEFQAPLTIEVFAPEPAPEPPSGGFSFRGIFCRDEEFNACYPNPFRTMNLTVMECYIYTGTTNLKKRMDQLQAPDMGWSILSSYSASTSGGTFKLTDADCRAAVASVRDHPRNSHVYYIADDVGNDLTGMSKSQQDACRNKLKARRDLVHQEDPQAVVVLSDYREKQLSPAASGRAAGMWGGVVDMVVCDGYPIPNVDQAPEVIPNQAKWCEAAGIDYMLAISCHDFQGNQPSWPTEAQEQKMIDQALQTKAKGVFIYIWYDAEGSKHLSQDPTRQQFLGSCFADMPPL